MQVGAKWLPELIAPLAPSCGEMIMGHEKKRKISKKKEWNIAFFSRQDIANLQQEG